MLAVGRALMSRARLLLLDEPSMGLAPMLVQEIFRVILRLNRAGATVLLVEQNAHLALEVAHRAISWRRAKSPCPARRPTSGKIPRFRTLTWVSPERGRLMSFSWRSRDYRRRPGGALIAPGLLCGHQVGCCSKR